VAKTNAKAIKEQVERLTSPLDYEIGEAAIILAAGHGKRIRSRRSKMLHRIWGVPTVERVFNACVSNGDLMNVVFVVGNKAADVMAVIGARERTAFAYQEEQLGTGHAVRVGLEKIDETKFDGVLYVLPGDMGLIDRETLGMFKEKFHELEADMLVLTGLYEGPIEENSYGRILRVKEKDVNGEPAGEDAGKVVEVVEHKDILALAEDETYRARYRGKTYAYTKRELLETREFNSSVYAFDFRKLVDLVHAIKDENAQGEIYLTDLIGIFNDEGCVVRAISPREQHVIMGFNDKTVLKQMEQLHRQKVYDRIRNVIEIDDPEDFFIHEEVVERILELDAAGKPLDIRIGKGAHVGKGVKPNYNLELMKNAFVEGNVRFGKNVTVWSNTHLSCYPSQEFAIGDDVEILWGDIIKGSIVIGEGSRIESSVNMTGSDEFPLRIGKNVLIKGTSYLFGSVVEDGVKIEHSVLIKKHVYLQRNRKGEPQPVKFYLPLPSGADAVEDLQ
jgi:bifunctional UDP-N-acetylglucosamine pyrophosphorylase / glucosamine-1-phosphate N-acetyltransferase